MSDLPSNSPFYRFDPALNETNRQRAYEERMVKVLLNAVAIRNQLNPHGFFQQFKREESSQMNFLHVCPRLSLPIALTARRVESFSVADLVAHGRKGLKHEVWTIVREQHANYDNDSVIGVVFDCHGDGVPDMVVHNLPGDAFDNVELFRPFETSSEEEGDQWCVTVRRVGQTWHIQPWQSVARRLAALSNW